MFCISVNYKSAELSLREKLVFSEREALHFSKALVSAKNVSQLVLLSTCNRTEVYFCGDCNSAEAVVAALAEFAGISTELLLKHIFSFFEDKAVRHLFRVTSGIDSMVIGEDEILGQTKNAYQLALENGLTGYELNMIFQASFACAKKIKTETVLSKTSVSVATIASGYAARHGSNILVIGAGGKVGASVLKNLDSYKHTYVKATLRRHGSQISILQKTNIEVVDYQKRYEYIAWADCIISATSSPHYTLTAVELKKVISDDKERLFIDLAVPPDIDRRIKQIGNTALINIDDIEGLARENKQLKLDSVSQAEQIITQETDVLQKDLLFHAFVPHMAKLFGDTAESVIYKLLDINIVNL